MSAAMHDDPRPGFNALRDKMLWHLKVHANAKPENLAEGLANMAFEALGCPASTAMADERAAFEAAILAMPGGEPSLLRRRDALGSARPGEYVDHTIQVGWMCWQAGRAALAAPKAEAPEWASCETRGPVFRGWLREAAIHLRGREKSVRAAYAKDYMRVPCEYVAEAYAEAAAAIERRLALLAPPAHQGATHHE